MQFATPLREAAKFVFTVGMARPEVHVLITPWIAEGHVHSMLRFAQSLATHQGLLVTFGYPARSYTLAHKRNKISNDVAHCASIRVEVVADGLPTEEDQAPKPSQYRASEAIMQNALELLIQQLMTDTSTAPALSWPPISCIISDTFLPWMQALADKAGIPRVDFWTCNATVYNMALHLPDIISRGHLPLKGGGEEKWVVEAPLIDFIPGLPPFPVTHLPRELVQTVDVSHARYQFMLRAFSRVRDADRILVHAVYELESGVFDAMQADGIPIYSVGPLFHTPSQPTLSANMNEECLQWLDKQDAASVIYVAFGTLASLSLQETHSMALGLEASGHPFLWVIRADSLTNGTLSESLPQGFLDRTVARSKGFIVPWSPQTEVLKHPSVAVFFSHCGWNSVLECLWEGLPMVACPRVAEQMSNANYIVEKWKIGVEVERQEDGSFTKEAVEKAVEAIMVNAQQAKERALHFKQVVRHTIEDGGTSHSNLLNFVERLRYLAKLH